MKRNKKSGFTLLELIIVIIILGVLASLALPRFFSTVEYSKSSEALNIMGSLRQSIERCFLQNNNTYVGCTLASLDMPDPSAAPGSHFGYTLPTLTATNFVIVGTRNAFDGGDGTSTITLTSASGAVTRTGTGVYSGIR
jgi:prepilin-type N-terminal cleavage/methylation domain-containing protein